MPEVERVAVPPPFVFGGVLALGLAARRWRGARPRSRSAARITGVAGGAVAALGAALSGAVVRRFARAGTPVSPTRRATALVTDGPYRYSRNPDYIGQALLLAGSAVACRAWWAHILLPAALAFVDRVVVPREERQLEEAFGAAYERYAARTPRWLGRPVG